VLVKTPPLAERVEASAVAARLQCAEFLATDLQLANAMKISLMMAAIIVYFASSSTLASPVAAAPLDESTATNYAIAGSLAGPALVVLGVVVNKNSVSGPRNTAFGVLAFTGIGVAVVGPSAGRWYAGSSGWKTMAVRAAGLASIVVGASVASCNGDRHTTDSCGPSALGIPLAIAGAGTLIGTTIYDIATAGDHARQANQSRGMTLMPSVGMDNGFNASLVLRGEF
jgi:hypothetical protein